eukprot:scaffold82460_cov53-Phaeocystis_antarctica.AAC.2
MACEPEGRRETVCAAGTSWGTLRRLPSSVCVLDATWQVLGTAAKPCRRSGFGSRNRACLRRPRHAPAR